MSTLANFLAAKEPLFDHALKQLEERTDKQGIDAKLTAEIATKSALKTRQLGLGPNCSGPELFAALEDKIAKQDQHLVRQIGGTDPQDVGQMLPLVAKTALAANMPRRGFFIKLEVAADLLTNQPPEGILKRLGYGSVQSLLASEDLQEIYLALRFAEESDWLTRFNQNTASLKPGDFEARDIRLIQYDLKKWGNVAEKFIAGKFHNITNSKEIGAIAMMPMMASRMKAITTKDLSLIFHYYNEIRLYSAFFKLMRHKRNFGEIVASTLIADPSRVSIVHGSQIHWRVIQRYFGKHPEGHPEIFEPHLQPEDLHWRKAEEVLYDIDPELEFWKDLDYVAAVKGKDIVTFNLLDVAFGYSNELSYADRYVYHFRESLWNEVFARYMGQKTLRDQLLIKLDNDLIEPEKL